MGTRYKLSEVSFVTIQLVSFRPVDVFRFTSLTFRSDTLIFPLYVLYFKYLASNLKLQSWWREHGVRFGVCAQQTAVLLSRRFRFAWAQPSSPSMNFFEALFCLTIR